MSIADYADIEKECRHADIANADINTGTSLQTSLKIGLKMDIPSTFKVTQWIYAHSGGRNCKETGTVL